MALSGCVPALSRSKEWNIVRHRRYLRLFPTLLLACTLAAWYHCNHGQIYLLERLHWSVHGNQAHAVQAESLVSRPSTAFSCRNIPGAENILIVLKTGATELEDKLPIHFTSTLRCYSRYLIFSDFQEVFKGQQVFDVLRNVDADIRLTHPDFEIWRRLQKGGGRGVLQPWERSGKVGKKPGALGRPNNPGWRLDKWKFLPMMNETLVQEPAFKWYVFLETDTYVFWQSLVRYLQSYDWTVPYYIGNQIQIGDITFAHGGSGFAISRPGLEQVVHNFRLRRKDWEAFTEYHWAGDCILGKAVLDSGVTSVHAWPAWLADGIGEVDYQRVDQELPIWCADTISYHHLSPEAVQDLWDFEQQWVGNMGDVNKTIRHGDVYKYYILPRVQEPKYDWDNFADEDRGPVESLEQCRMTCKSIPTCVQYVFGQDLRCRVTSRPKLGEFAKGAESGWIHDRMYKAYNRRPVCH